MKKTVSALFACLEGATRKISEKTIWQEITFVVDIENPITDNDFYLHATELARNYETECINAEGITVFGKFKKILDISALVSEVVDGAELFSRFLTSKQKAILENDTFD